MVYLKRTVFAFIICSRWLKSSYSFIPYAIYSSKRTVASTSKLPTSSSPEWEDRREFLAKILASASTMPMTTYLTTNFPTPAFAADDLTSRLFNEDGSLKQEMETEAKYRNIDLIWDVADDLVVAVDGSKVGGAGKEMSVALRYKLPEKWDDGQDLYLDRSEGVNQKACNHITVYQAPGTAKIERLEKAARVGIAKSLDVTENLSPLKKADLISGRTVTKNDQKYYEFDMAVAPDVCDSSSAENLGLGFCPYDNIYLLSSTVLNERLYVFVAECDKSQWKRANAELRRIRSSFVVETV